LRSIPLLLLAAVVLVPPASLHAADAPHVLLYEALQFENIGDQGRAVGAVRLIYRHLPDATVTLWPIRLHQAREQQMLQRAFPKLRIARGELTPTGEPSTAELAEAWRAADICVFATRQKAQAEAWAKTGKPYGYISAQFDPVSLYTPGSAVGRLDQLRASIVALPPDNLDVAFKPPKARAAYEGASFIFPRDSLSLRYLKDQKLRTPLLALGTDTTFGIDVRDEPRADRWLRRVGAEDGRFICVVPCLRYDPNYRAINLPREESDYEIDRINAAHADKDHAPLRDLVTLCVRESGLKVMVCPEAAFQMAFAKEQLVDPLPADVKPNVIWRDTFWLADEACSVYARAAAVVSMECHSPILAISQGTPAFYVRIPSMTVKGQMFHDLGLGDWVFESGETTGPQLWTMLRPLLDDRSLAQARIRAAMTKAEIIQHRMVKAIADAVEN
jgi:polysaccharide pyruvyl transferase WcaK-like protein